MSINTAQAPVGCDICDPNSVANWKCIECEQKLCNSCKTLHLKVTATKSHKIIDLIVSLSQPEGNREDKIATVEQCKDISQNDNTNPGVKEFLNKIAEKEAEVSSLDKHVEDLEKYKDNYASHNSTSKDEVRKKCEEVVLKLKEAEKELCAEIDKKLTKDMEILVGFIEDVKSTKTKHSKMITYIRQVFQNIPDDQDMIDQFIKDSTSKLDSILISLKSDLPKPLKLDSSDDDVKEIVGILKEDVCFGSDQKPLYRSEFEIEKKFKPEDGRTSVYSIGVRPDGKVWLATMSKYLYLVTRSGNVLDICYLDFLPTLTAVGKYGQLFCTSWGGTAINVAKKDCTVTEFENLKPYKIYGLHVTKDFELLVSLQKPSSPSKVAIFSEAGMMVREIIGTEDEPMFKTPTYLAQTSKGQICVVDGKSLIVVEKNGKKFAKYEPQDETWVGKSLIVDDNDNLFSGTCPLKMIPQTVHVLNTKGEIIKKFTIEGPGISGINALAIDKQYDEPVLWMGTPMGHVIIAKYAYV